MTDHAIFPLHLGGSICWWIYAIAEKKILLDTGEYFRKQSYHNRMHILSANGKLALSVPTAGGNFHKPLHQVEISYAHVWIPKFKQALQSAYGSSPYYAFYDYLIEPILTKEYYWLHEFSLSLTQWINTQLKAGLYFDTTSQFVESPVSKDYRNYFNAKKTIGSNIPLDRYAQTFEYKFGFTPDLSILDLLFNLGPSSYSYLLKHTTRLMNG